jgi:hypothetical protein
MARQVTASISGLGVTNTIGININESPVNVAVAVMLSDGAIMKYTVEHTYEDVWQNKSQENFVWFPFIENQTVNADGYYAFPVTGVRVRVMEYVQGTVTFKVIQAGI